MSSLSSCGDNKTPPAHTEMSARDAISRGSTLVAAHADGRSFATVTASGRACSQASRRRCSIGEPGRFHRPRLLWMASVDLLFLVGDLSHYTARGAGCKARTGKNTRLLTRKTAFSLLREGFAAARTKTGSPCQRVARGAGGLRAVQARGFGRIRPCRRSPVRQPACARPFP